MFVIAAVAMMLFAAATQSWFLTRTKIWESVALLLVAFTLFRPGFWLDIASPPYDELAGTQAIVQAESLPDGSSMRVKISGPDFDDADRMNHTNVILELGDQTDAESRFMQAGLMVIEDNGKLLVDGVTWDSQHKQLDRLFSLGDPDNPLVIDKVLLERERSAKEWFYLPAILLLGLIIMLQRGRIRKYGHPALVDDE